MGHKERLPNYKKRPHYYGRKLNAAGVIGGGRFRKGFARHGRAGRRFDSRTTDGSRAAAGRPLPRRSAFSAARAVTVASSASSVRSAWPKPQRMSHGGQGMPGSAPSVSSTCFFYDTGCWLL